MKIHEYQAHGLLRQYGVRVPEGRVAFDSDGVYKASCALGDGPFILKAQVHTGGRGKAGGIKRADNPEEAASLARGMFNHRLVTKQTGPEGKLITRVLVTRSVAIKKEYYLSFTVDGASAGVVMLASSEGGMEIEETAAKSPEKIIRESIDITVGLREYQLRRVAARIGIQPELFKGFAAMASGIYRLFIEKDCSLVEINPMVETDEGCLLALDAKITFDENALFRHEDILSLRDLSEEDPKEAEAAKYNLNYISLDGEIGCMVNGAGLAMATMDIIRHFGGRPANFLDVGGSATAERVAGAFGILLSDGHVKSVLINIFGGIMKCDIIAKGIVAAAEQIGVGIPIVVRLEGTNAEQGREILLKSGLSIISADTLRQAAQKAVEISRAREVSA